MIKYEICVQCVMDNSDPEITFDAEGVCSHCENFDKAIKLAIIHQDTFHCN